jgi:Ca2+-binding RTX toxin-like protein
MPVTWTLEGGILTIEGSEQDDRIGIQELAHDPATQSVTVRGSLNGIADPFLLFDRHLSGVQKIIVNGNGGNDSLLMAVKNISTDLYGGEGDDLLRGGQKIDIIQGGAGDDTIQTAGNWSHHDRIDGGEGIDTLNNQADSNSRISRSGLDLENSIEVLTLNMCSIDGDDRDNIFDFSNTTLDNVGGRHAWYQRSRGGNDIVYTSPNLVNIVNYRGWPENIFWYDGDGYGYGPLPEGTQDRINIVLTAEQLNNLTASQISQLKAYVINPSIYQQNHTFSLVSTEANIAFRASNFEQASIVLKSGDALIDLTDSLLDTQAVKVGTNGRNKLTAPSDRSGFLIGLGGNDTLIGNSRDDILIGGSGDDLFKFRRGFGRDTITDFKQDGQDKIDLRAFRLSGLRDLTITDTDDTIITSAAFGDSRITLKRSDSQLLRSQELNGGLSASDFLF